MIPEQAEGIVTSTVDKRDSWSARWQGVTSPRGSRLRGYAAFLFLLMLLFMQPLTSLVLYAAHSDLHSHIILVPFISLYLLFLRRRQFSADYCSSMAGSLTMAMIGSAAVAARIVWRASVSMSDGLALTVLGFVAFAAAGGFLFLGSRWMAARAFPMTFLVFMVPLPDAAVNWLERASMFASAEAAAMYFDLTGTALVRHGTVFELPGIVLQVAQECSGIRSSWVLLITSLLASHLFLRSGWRKIVLVAFVIPLGILRNGFRILVIGLLCVHVGPQMIDSSIHHRGGPIFFALSLFPLYLLLWWLRHQEHRVNLPG
jgi:exosortase C (VPDSG-CTERM-specific)